ncbi:Crp/Fnr family transcriptional regulator [Salinimicrobium sediminilitoris]|uniref:Crp/Fnr family transcriptional regulator n=1 Tax=Salinimicrobium sediminilitoris TaxID=2876715 RepID=UPI001E51EAF8|nr:Crp/Fnr family transcriptional regulator [Salinimicrobium sediminilitoris]MCC8359426.1 Crp/Fnr family transcriptional regulator [Salinimicrobium sediminilitoris]
MNKDYLNLELFNTLSLDEKELLKKHCTVVIFDETEVLFKQGSFAVNCYLFLDGIGKVVYSNKGRKRIVKLLHANDIVGLDYIFTTENYPYSVYTITKCETLVIQPGFIKKMFLANPVFGMELSKRLNRTLSNTISWLINLDFKNIDGAVAMFLMTYYGYTTRNKTLFLSRIEIADIIGYSRESVILTLKSFGERGYIQTAGKSIIILEPEKLEEIIRLS